VAFIVVLLSSGTWAGSLHLRVVQQLVGGAGEHDVPGLHHISAIGDAQRRARFVSGIGTSMKMSAGLGTGKMPGCTRRRESIGARFVFSSLVSWFVPGLFRPGLESGPVKSFWYQNAGIHLI
jgi:hypothetical protein